MKKKSVFDLCRNRNRSKNPYLMNLNLFDDETTRICDGMKMRRICVDGKKRRKNDVLISMKISISNLCPRCYKMTVRNDTMVWVSVVRRYNSRFRSARRRRPNRDS
jgi:hypothetical protein